ncbi:MAG: hypothetical protein E7621_04210 [Ruminococcaceae bacterium]|nr:hypothetical protein [Oscillospiraceae bacterium]
MKKKNEFQKKLESLSCMHSVCGNDGGMFEYISSVLEEYCDSISKDSMGNIIAKRSCSDKKAKTVAIVAVCDEYGFAVTSVCEEAKKLHPVGLKKEALLRLSGKAAYTLSGKKGMLVPCGEELVFETDDVISEGDFVYPDDKPQFFGNDKVYLLGAAAKVFSACLCNLAVRDGQYPCNIEFVFMSSHLPGARGAAAASYKICADEVIALDFVTGSSVKSGRGPVIAFGDSQGFCDREMTDELKECADGIGIKVQMCAEIQKERPSILLPFLSQGKKTSLVGVSCESEKEGISKCDIKDILGCEAVVCAYLIKENGEI